MSKPLDRLTLLGTFVRIAERGSISRAARDLGLSQASVSRQLKDLEDRFGAVLIRRTTHSLALTPAGQGLLRDARDLVSAWAALEERHGSSDGSVKGPLKIVAPVALGQHHLADIACGFQRAHPAVAITWLLQDEPIRFAEIGCDCWIKVGAVPDDMLIVRDLGRVERLLVAAPDPFGPRRAFTPEEVARLPCVALDPFEGGRIGLTARDRATTTLTPDVSFSTNSIFAQHRAALNGVGFAVLPRWFVEADLQAGRLIDLLPDWRAETLPINAAFMPARFQPRRLSLLLDQLAAEVPRIPGIWR